MNQIEALLGKNTKKKAWIRTTIDRLLDKACTWSSRGLRPDRNQLTSSSQCDGAQRLTQSLRLSSLTCWWRTFCTTWLIRGRTGLAQRYRGRDRKALGHNLAGNAMNAMCLRSLRWLTVQTWRSQLWELLIMCLNGLLGHFFWTLSCSELPHQVSEPPQYQTSLKKKKSTQKNSSLRLFNYQPICGNKLPNKVPNKVAGECTWVISNPIELDERLDWIFYLFFLSLSSVNSI